jgi:saccharopine dehydrogenase-like NADP-dependent oxidoreductase
VLDRLAGSHSRLSIRRADLSDPATVSALVSDFDLVISAVPGPMGYATLEAILEAGVNAVDIAFFEEDPFTLDELARERGATAVIDCGVAPGMSNILTMHGVQRLDSAHTALTYVGGLPEVRRWPYEYAAVFSPIDVIAEYTRPARYVENGQRVVRPALSDAELLEFPGIGTLEAFNTDGLRTLATTLELPNMKEKTLRYPGHIQKMAVLRESGFFGEEPVDVGGHPVRPIDLTARLLFPLWQLPEGEADLTVMKVIVEGERDGEPVRLGWDLHDRYDETTGVHSMARTTGYTATAVARLIAAGHFDRPGITPPERLGEDPTCVAFVLDRLRERGVVYTEFEERG